MKILLSIFSFTFIIEAQCLIAIDIGHTPKQAGATSARGITEYKYNKRAAISLYYTLEQKGLEPFFINAEEREIKLNTRAKIANDTNANLFISMHHDSVKEKYLSTWTYNKKTHKYSDTFNGYSLFVSPKNKQFKESLRVAKEIGFVLNKEGYTPTLHHAEPIKGENKKLYDRKKGIYRYDNLVVLKRSNAPAVLIENGVIVNRNELNKIDNPEYREAFISALAKGINNWCRTRTHE